MIDKIMQLAGVNPQQLMEVATKAQKEYEAFKTGFQNAMKFFHGETTEMKARLDKIEAAQTEILAHLRGEKQSAEVVQLEDMRQHGS